MADKRNKPRNPILNMREFELQHAERDVQLKKYMTTKRGRAALDDATANTLKDQAALSLKANATLARVEFARALAELAEKRSQKMAFPFFLTLAPAQFSMSIADAPRFDVEKIIQWGQKVLKSCDHVTFVEAALYTNFQAPRDSSLGAVHWHLHSVVWGDEYHASEIMGDMIGDPQPTFIPGLRLAHERPLSPDMVAGRFLYMAKAPLSEYRVYARTQEVHDLITGEPFEVPSGQYIQRKRALRPGGASLLCRIIGSRDLQSLTFAGGEGEKILSKALSRAPVAISTKMNEHSALIPDGKYPIGIAKVFNPQDPQKGWVPKWQAR